MDEIVISYETLFELLRIERSKTELQTLPDSYIEDVKNLIDLQVKGLRSIDNEDEKKKGEIHIKNMLKILNEIYERREKKIMNMALDKSKTKSAIIDFSKFLEKEKEMFHEIIALLDKYRLNMTEGVLSMGEIKENSEQPKDEISSPEDKKEEMPEQAGNVENNGSSVEPGPEVQSSPEKKKMRTVRFLSAMPSFLGPELGEYGPFDEEDIANLPSKIVDLLVQKKRAEEIVID